MPKSEYVCLSVRIASVKRYKNSDSLTYVSSPDYFRRQVCISDGPIQHDASASASACRSSKTRLVVAYTDRIVRLFTWHDSYFVTSATLGGLSSPFEEIHVNPPPNDGSTTTMTMAATAAAGDAVSNTASAQGMYDCLIRDCTW